MDSKAADKILDSYALNANGLKARIEILQTGDFAPIYHVIVPGIGEATRLLILSLRPELLNLVPIDLNRMGDKKYIEDLTIKYTNASNVLLGKYLPRIDEKTKEILIAYIINMMIGLGDLEPPLADEKLEEIAVNGGKIPVWVYHTIIGWCKTDIIIGDDTLVYNISEQIGRRVGRQITNLAPIMDAELVDGSRVDATLFPISQSGNTITIRKFRKNPWTVTALVEKNSVSVELAALIWLCMQNEISMLISGGTASGKTSFLNAISIFIPVSRRVISVEETRELTLPKFLQWLPMLTRMPNPEGKGEISLYNLMVNSLRQRPDTMLVGEIRTGKDAETLFEAIHTGHSVYGTVHADNAQDTILRMTNPPIAIPKIMMNAVGGVISLFRHRRLGIRRALEFGEVLESGDVNVLYRWDVRSDTISRVAEPIRLYNLISLYTGFDNNEIKADLEEKMMILNWMSKNKLFDIDQVGYVVANYYKDRENVLKASSTDVPYKEGIFGKV
jgi:flagellar protein FlaI